MSDRDTAEETPSLHRRVQWRRIVSVLAVVVLVVVVLPFVVYAFPQLVGGERSYVVLSGSMSPAIGPGDVIVVGSVQAGDVQVGDVITFRRSGESRPTTHRVVDVLNQNGGVAFRTAGDNNEDPDPDLVEPSQLVGKVVTIGGYLLVIPEIGRVIMFSSTQTGFLLLGLVPIGLFVVNELWNVIDATRSEVDPPNEDEGQTAPGRETDTGDDAIAFSAEELRVGVAVLFAFLAYSIWVAYATVETWALGAVGAVGAAFLLGAGLLVFGDTAGGTADGRATTPTDFSNSRTRKDGVPPPEGDKEVVSDTSVNLVNRLFEADTSTTADGGTDDDHSVSPSRQEHLDKMYQSEGDEDDE